jgi:hypothetical protein
MTKVYKCRGCGELDTIVEITLCTEIQEVSPDGDGGFTYGPVVTFHEEPIIVGYGCNGAIGCPNWQGNYPGRDDDSRPRLDGPALDEVADVAEDDRIDPLAKLARCRCRPSHSDPTDCPEYGGSDGRNLAALITADALGDEIHRG